jgi:hypothetical protein
MIDTTQRIAAAGVAFMQIKHVMRNFRTRNFRHFFGSRSRNSRIVGAGAGAETDIKISISVNSCQACSQFLHGKRP